MKRFCAFALSVLFCFSFAPASAQTKSEKKRLIYTFIKADLCKDWKPSKHSPDCLYSSDWVSEVDIDGNGTSEFILAPGFPWIMPDTGDNEVRIYEVQRPNRLVRIFRGTGSISLVQNLHTKRHMPDMLTVDKDGRFTFFKYDKGLYKKVSEHVSKRSAQRKVRELKKKEQARSARRFKRANKPHSHKSMQKHCYQNCPANDKGCIVCGC